MFYLRRHRQAGLTLVEMIVVLAITVTIFTAIFTALEYAMFLIANSQARMSAISLATDRIEYYRSLPFHDVGAVGSPVPGNGSVPNVSTTSLNGIDFTETISVFFVNDPGDDVAGVDSNGIINDYKKVQVEIEWTVRGQTDNVEYTTNIVPVSVETAEGYGAVKIEVIDDATGLPLPGAEVHITHAGDLAATPAIPAQDFTVNTAANGIALVSLIAGSGYHASATDSGYSFDTTYASSSGNPNPTPNSFTVAEALIADRPFRIGELSDLRLRILSGAVDTNITELFTSGSGIQASSSVEITSDTLVLRDIAGVYDSSGNAILQPITPVTLESWGRIVVIGDDPSGTAYNVQLYDGDCSVSCSLISDGDLAGNSTGITDTVIDISNLDVSTYPTLTIQLNLTGDTTDTPSIDEVSLYYRESSTARSSYNFNLEGEKVIGTSPNLYKFNYSLTTDSSGDIELLDQEFDQFKATSTGTFIPTDICANTNYEVLTGGLSFAHQSGQDSDLEVTLENTGAHTLLAYVTDASGEPLPGATVSVDNGTFSDSVETNHCGQAFINNAVDADDYDVDVTRNGYTTDSRIDFTISGESRLGVSMNES